MTKKIYFILLGIGAISLFALFCCIDFLFCEQAKQIYYQHGLWRFLNFEIKRQAFMAAI